MYYGGSQTSTSEGISKVFKRGVKFLENNSEDRPVVVFDEIGLAELSPFNPLKILHPLLERTDVEIGFLGLSNWTLDLSKMNRLVYLARPDMTKDDLNEIFKISVARCSNLEIRRDLELYLGYLTAAYLEFRVWQKRFGNHPNFHGSRDIYGVSKYIYRHMSSIKHYHTSEKARDLIKAAIERNFNGAVYLFGRQSNFIEPSSVDGLQQVVHDRSKQLSMIRIKDLGDVYLADSSESIVQFEDKPAIFNSTEIFKRIFKQQIESNSI